MVNHPPKTYIVQDFVDEAVSLAMHHAIRAAIPSTLGSSPGTLVPNRDMFRNTVNH